MHPVKLKESFSLKFSKVITLNKITKIKTIDYANRGELKIHKKPEKSIFHDFIAIRN